MHEEFHQVLVHGRRRRLDHKHVVARIESSILTFDLAVRKPAEARIGQGDAQRF